MKKLTPDYKAHLLARARDAEKKKLRSKRFRLVRISGGGNIHLASLASQRRYREQQIEQQQQNSRAQVYEFKPGSEFSIIDEPKNVINFTHRLKSYAKKAFKGYKVRINLDEVIKIDIGAICVLLSVIKELTYFGIEVSSTIPKHVKCKQILTESGYSGHVRSLSELIPEPKNKNLILIKGKDKTKNKDVGETIKQAVEILTGQREHFPPIFSIIQEINGNSIEHAYDKKKHEHWLLAINHDSDSNKVVFTFADNGVGILKTLKRKVRQKVFETMQLYSDSDILKGAFTKNYTSRHEYQVNRNKGLPLLKKIQSQSSVKKLFVITNGVFLYIDDYKAVEIDKEFSGTFYYWEFDIDCIKQWKAKKSN